MMTRLGCFALAADGQGQTNRPEAFAKAEGISHTRDLEKRSRPPRSRQAHDWPVNIKCPPEFEPTSTRMTGNRVYGFLLLVLALSACTLPREPLPMTPAGDSKGAAVVRRPLPESPVPALASQAPPVVVPTGSLYVCVSESGGSPPQQTAIVFAPKVGTLCVKHPEMGPCQYERDVCRRSGGRVYGVDGAEITLQTEAEYDKKVMRVRFKAN